MNRMRNVLTGLLILLASAPLMAQGTITGKWKTIDDNTGEARSIVEILEQEGKVFGRVVKIFPRPNVEPDPVCKKCSPDDPRFNKKIIGMEVIRNLAGTSWTPKTVGFTGQRSGWKEKFLR
jgi:hypothetical protein